MKKGFTLIEMLGVITLIALLALIIFPIINNQLNENKEKLYNIQITNIENASKNYGADNIHLLPYKENEEIVVTLETLINEGYIDENITNPLTKEEFDKGLEVKITYEGGKLNYEVLTD